MLDCWTWIIMLQNYIDRTSANEITLAGQEAWWLKSNAPETLAKKNDQKAGPFACGFRESPANTGAVSLAVAANVAHQQLQAPLCLLILKAWKLAARNHVYFVELLVQLLDTGHPLDTNIYIYTHLFIYLFVRVFPFGVGFITLFDLLARVFPHNSC